MFEALAEDVDGNADVQVSPYLVGCVNFGV
jgi:hypothetical protein